MRRPANENAPSSAVAEAFVDAVVRPGRGARGAEVEAAAKRFAALSGMRAPHPRELRKALEARGYRRRRDKRGACYPIEIAAPVLAT